MKVALVTHTFLPHFIGGRETFCINLAKSTLKANVDCEIFCGDHVSKSFIDKYKGVVVHRVPNYTIRFGMYPYRFVHLDLWKELDNYDPDIIHVLDYRHFTTDISFFYSKLKKKPIVLSIHGLGYFSNLWMKIILKYYDTILGRYVLSNMDAIIVYPLSQWIKKLNEKAVIIEHGIDLDLNCDISNFFDLKEPFALCIGRLAPIKGFEPVIKAFKHLKKYRLVIAGGDLNSTYSQTLQSLNKDVMFTDNINSDLIKSALYHCKFFIQSNIFGGGYGYALMEAMSMSKPILCNKAEYLKGLINNENAKIIDFKNQKQLKDSIKDFFENNHDIYGKKARETVLPYDWNKIVQKFIQVYKNVLGEKTC